MGRGDLLQFDQAGVAHSLVDDDFSLVFGNCVVHTIDIPCSRRRTNVDAIASAKNSGFSSFAPEPTEPLVIRDGTFGRQRSKNLDRRLTNRKTKVAIAQIVCGAELLPRPEFAFLPVRKTVIFIENDDGAALNSLFQ